MGRTIVMLLLSTLLFISCNKQEAEVPSLHKNKTQVTVVSGEEVPHIAALGDSVAKTLLATLKHELITTIKKEGVVEAIKVCNVKALPLTEKTARRFGSSIDVKRTTFKVRNPKNQPDSLEIQALQFFQNALENGQPLPAHFIQKIQNNNRVVYRYYMPLKVAPLCLNCHGDPGHMPEALKQELAQLYPNDQATGYQAGDFRGVIRVEISSQE